MVLQNVVLLEDGTPAIMHWVDHHVVPRRVTDPVTGDERVLNALEFDVDELDGAQVAAIFSTVSSKLAALLEPLLPGRTYRGLLVVVERGGTAFNTEYSVRTLDRTPQAAPGALPASSGVGPGFWRGREV